MKKFIALVLVVCCMLCSFGCGNGECYSEGDFELIIFANKKKVRVGEKVVLCAVLTNISEKDIEVKIRHGKEVWVSIFADAKTKEPIVSMPHGSSQTSRAEEKKVIIKSGEEVVRIKEIVIEVPQEPFRCFAFCSFVDGSNANFYIQSEDFFITVLED